MKAWPLILLGWGLASSCLAQDTVLKVLLEQSEVIAHVKVLTVEGGQFDEQGVEECTAECEIVDPIKGTLEKEGKLRFHFNRYVFHKVEEPVIVEKGRQYLLFLLGPPKDQKMIPPFRLVDRWIGALPYNFHLRNHVKELADKKR
jgi:hypothetical protein